MHEHETTHRMQRPELLGLLHEILQNDLVTAPVRSPLGATARDVAELNRETAIIAVPRADRVRWQAAAGFVIAFVTGFALTFSIVY